MLSSFILIIYLGTTLAQPDPSVSPLSWQYGSSEMHHLIQASSTTPALDAILADECLLLRKRTSEQKAQLVQANFLVDLSEVARQEDNIRAGIRVLREAQPELKTAFSTCPTCHFEYLQHKNVTYFECDTLCKVDRSGMVDNLEKIEEAFHLEGHGSKLDLGKIWIRTDQESKNKGKFLVDYRVQVADGGHFVPIFPINTVNHLPTVCYDHANGRPTRISECKNLGAEIKYWSNRRGTGKDTFYERTHLKLLVRLVLSKDYLFYRDKGLINETVSMTMFQRKHLRFEIVLPRSRIAQEQESEKASCLCHRPVSQLRLGLSTAEHHTLVKLETHSRSLTLGLEKERLRHSGLPQLSNVQHLLTSTLPENIPSDLISAQDVFPLQINSLSLSTQKNQSDWNSIVTELGKNEHLLDNKFNFTKKEANRSKRGLPAMVATAAFSGLFKAGIEVGKPYFSSQSSLVFEKLMKSKEGILLEPSHLETNVLSAGELQAYLEMNANAAIRYEVQPERLKVKFLDFPNIEAATNTNYSAAAFQQLDSAIARSAYFEAHILPTLPHLLLRRLYPLIHSSTSSDSAIFVQIQRAKSFVLLSYFYEKLNKDSFVTKFAFFALPCQVTNNELFTLAISNVTVEIGTALQRDTSQTQEYLCQSLFMTDKVVTVKDHCQLEEIAEEPVTTGLELNQGTLFLFDGGNKIYLACQNQPARTLLLTFRFNVFLISPTCAIAVHFTSGQRWHRAPLQQAGAAFTFLHILQYDPAYMRSPLQKNRIIMVILMTITILLVLGIGAVVALLYFWRRRYAVQISVSPSLTNRNGSKERETSATYKATEKVDNESMIVPDSLQLAPPSTSQTVSKAAVSFAVENAAEIALCNKDSLCETSQYKTSFPYYSVSSMDDAQIHFSQPEKLSNNVEWNNLPRMKVPRLSLDSTWTEEESDVDSLLQEVAARLRPLQSPGMLRTFKQTNEAIPSTSPPQTKQTKTITTHKPAQH